MPEWEAPLVVIVPHRDRDSFVSFQAPELLRYLRARHPEARHKMTVLCVEQRDGVGGPYSKGLSWNVALRHLVELGWAPDTQVVLNDVDIVPRSNVSFRCPPRGRGTLWFQNTGGLKARLGDLVEAHGFPMAITGWGYEDVAMWRRLERLVGVSLHHWKEEIDPKHKAVVLNLEWEPGLPASEVDRLREWFWGDDGRSHVHMVGQGDERWGVGSSAAVPVPSKDGWYSESQRARNERMGDAVEALRPAEYRELCEADGLRALRWGVVPCRLESLSSRFPGVVVPDDDPSLLNLSFESQDVLGATPKLFLEDARLSWYFGTARAGAHASVLGASTNRM